MNDTLDTPELTELAQVVRWAPVDPQDAARIALGEAGRDAGYGRLAELAVWWASVRDDAAAPKRPTGAAGRWLCWLRCSMPPPWRGRP